MLRGKIINLLLLLQGLRHEVLWRDDNPLTRGSISSSMASFGLSQFFLNQFEDFLIFCDQNLVGLDQIQSALPIGPGP